MTLNQLIFTEYAIDDNCPLCKGDGINYIDTLIPGSGVTYNKCKNCESLWTESNYDAYHKPEEFIADTPSLRNYLHVGAGIDTFYSVLNGFVAPKRGGHIDVGTGAGHCAHVGGTLFDSSAGFDPNLYFKPTFLDSNIEKKMYEFNSSPAVISMFEVIEHLHHRDISGFLESVKSDLRSDGVLVGSTPNSVFINPSVTEEDALRLLFPGEHKLLFSKRSLERTLKIAGFTGVTVLESGMSLYFCASKDGANFFNLDALSRRLGYTEMLTLLLRKKFTNLTSLDKEYLKGIEYRLYKELVCLPNLPLAEQFINGQLVGDLYLFEDVYIESNCRINFKENYMPKDNFYISSIIAFNGLHLMQKGIYVDKSNILNMLNIYENMQPDNLENKLLKSFYLNNVK